MKYINKFIATGLGFALMFTGTNFVHSMFKSTATQSNYIYIPNQGTQDISIRLDTKNAYFYKKYKEKGNLYIPLDINVEDTSNLEITAILKYKGGEIPIKDITIGKGIHKSCNSVFPFDDKHKHPDDRKNKCMIIPLDKFVEFNYNEKYNIILNFKDKDTDTLIFNNTYGMKRKYMCANIFDNPNIKHITLGSAYQNLSLNEEVLIEESSSAEEIKTTNEYIGQPNETEPVEPSEEEKIGQPNETEPVEPSEEEEIGQPNETEPVGPSKEEEIGQPNETEPAEPSKEEEIGQPNETEPAGPSKEEIIARPKEDEDIQE